MQNFELFHNHDEWDELFLVLSSNIKGFYAFCMHAIIFS